MVNRLRFQHAFRCPRTGIDVSRPSPDPAVDPSVYTLVMCPACWRPHLINESTGQLISERPSLEPAKKPAP